MHKIPRMSLTDRFQVAGLNIPAAKHRIVRSGVEACTIGTDRNRFNGGGVFGDNARLIGPKIPEFDALTVKYWRSDPISANQNGLVVPFLQIQDARKVL